MAAGVGLPLALSHLLHHRYDIRLVAPHALSGLLLILVAIPDWLSLIPHPLTLGLVLPDLPKRRA